MAGHECSLIEARRLSEFGHWDQERLKILAKNANICLSKGWRGEWFLMAFNMSFNNNAGVEYSLCTSLYLVMPTAGAIFTLWVLDKEDTHNQRN